MENNTLRLLNQLRHRTNEGHERAKSFTVSAAVREKLVQQLQADVRRLRDYLPPNFDGWGIL
jgi:hypothetical protein